MTKCLFRISMTRCTMKIKRLCPSFRAITILEICMISIQGNLRKTRTVREVFMAVCMKTVKMMILISRFSQF